MKITPLDDRVVIEPEPQEEVTASGIVIPDTASKEKPQIGKIIAVGSGKMLDSGKRLPMELKAGDKVIFGQYSGDEVKIDGKEYKIISQDNILGKIS